MGTQNLNFESIVQNTENILNITKTLSKKYEFPIDFINCGGGFGVLYFAKDKILDIDLLKKEMERIYKGNTDLFSKAEVAFESGRFIMADAGVFVTRILYDKLSHEKRFLVCDGGSNFHAASAFLGRFVRDNFPFSTLPTGSIEKT